MQYKPIVLFAFNRLEPLMATISSVLYNTEASKSDLYVYVDGASPHKEGEVDKVFAVQEFVKGIHGFKSLHYKFSDTNKGLGPSIIAGVTEVIKEHGAVIVLEDDLIVAKGFLSYMNTMLEAYQHDKRVMQISGFSTKHSAPKGYSYDIYLNRRCESWSWATWVDRWNSIDWEVKDYQDLLSNKPKQRAFNDIGSDLFGMLRGYMEGKNKSWAVRFCYAMFQTGRYAVAPMKSLVRNEGFNGDATNCTMYNRYKYEFNENQIKFVPVPHIQYIKSIDKSANKYWSICYRIYGKIMSFIYKSSRCKIYPVKCLIKLS